MRSFIVTEEQLYRIVKIATKTGIEHSVLPTVEDFPRVIQFLIDIKDLEEITDEN